jgi:hypothetical protein
MRFQSKYGIMRVHTTYMENVALKKGGTLSLYWVRNQDASKFMAAIIRRCRRRIYGEFIQSWDLAKSLFTQRIVQSGTRNGGRYFHTLSLYVGPDQHSDLFRCLAICKEGRKVVDCLHRERIGSVALAFQQIKRECGCKHRKKYEELDYYQFKQMCQTTLSAPMASYRRTSDVSAIDRG